MKLCLFTGACLSVGRCLLGGCVVVVVVVVCVGVVVVWCGVVWWGGGGGVFMCAPLRSRRCSGNPRRNSSCAIT